MKQPIIILLTVLFTNNAFTNTQTEKLEINIENLSKDWIFSDIINPNKTPEQIEEIKYFLEDNTITFNDDMTFESSFVLDLKGNWELKNNIIYTTDEKGKNKWTVHKLTKDKLHISRNDAKQIIIYKSN